MSVLDNLKIKNASASASGNSLHLINSASGKIKELKVYGESTQAAEPTPDYPQEIKSVVLSEIKTCGKNMFNPDDYLSKGYWSDIDTFNASESWYYYEIPVIQNTNYVISGRNSQASAVRIIGKDNKGKVLYNYGYIGGLINTSDSKIIGFSVKSTDFETLQFEVGEVATDYEPYTESIATLSNPITLNGLNGVQDYVDVKRGVLVQKFYRKVFTEEETIQQISNNRFRILLSKIAGDGFYKKIALSSHFESMTHNDVATTDKTNVFAVNAESAYFRVDGGTTIEQFNAILSKGIAIVYELAEPIETPLPDADVEALQALETFNPITNVFNDANAKMAVEYFKNNNIGQNIADVHKMAGNTPQNCLYIVSFDAESGELVTRSADYTE